MKASQQQAMQYAQIVNRHTPRRNWVRNSIRAFLVGGALCAVGQIALSTLLRRQMLETQAIALTSSIMIILGAVLTGLGFYDEIGRAGGMGAALPITGFANSIVSPAMEYKREGYVLGVSARMFQVAGPVIVYGLLSAGTMTLLRLAFQ